jgi:hypothetical protein
MEVTSKPLTSRPPWSKGIGARRVLKHDMWRIFLIFGIAVLFLIAVSVVGRVSEAMQRKRMKK